MYCYDVVALDKAGNRSDRSEPPLCVTTLDRDSTPPTNPYGVSISSISPSSMRISWDAANDNFGVESYIISQVNSGNLRSYIVGESQNTEFRVSGLNPNSEYCYSVAAVDLSGNVSLSSSAVCGRTQGIEQANWIMRSGCAGKNYIFEHGVHVDQTVSSSISFTSAWLDYDGKKLGGSFQGYYDATKKVLDGEVLYTSGNEYTRLDRFVADLGAVDTSDILTKTEWIGPDGSSLTCDTVVRFIRSSISNQDAEYSRQQHREGSLNTLP